MTSLRESTFHCQIVNAFMEDMQHYIRFNETKSGWKVYHSSGLCQNLRIYAVEVHRLHVHDDIRAVLRILFKIFEKNPGNAPEYPFGSYPRNSYHANMLEYHEECRSGSVYLNPKRLTFIQNWKLLVHLNLTDVADWKPL